MRFRWPLSDDNDKENTSLPIPLVGEYVSVPPESKEVFDQTKAPLTTNEGKVLLVSACLVSFAVGFRAGRIQPAWKRFTHVSEISDVGPNSPLLRGRVLSVSDGDTIRLLHTPTIFSPPKLQDGEKLSDTALPIRIATIDTPEVAKFGKPSQPYGDDAKDYLSSMIEDKTVKVRILSKDQYSRAVAQVSKPGFLGLFGGQDMDEAMLKAGLAEVYRGGGAVYGPKGKDAYIEMEQSAKDAGKGMWADKKRESAADFKARLKAES